MFFIFLTMISCSTQQTITSNKDKANKTSNNESKSATTNIIHTCLVEFNIEDSGSSSNHKIIYCTDKTLEESVLLSVKKTKYEPNTDKNIRVRQKFEFRKQQ